jgi:Zn-dependent protease with chaperone function
MFGNGLEDVRQLSVSLGQVWPAIMFSLLLFILHIAGHWKQMEVQLEKAPFPEDKKWGVLVIIITLSFIFCLFGFGLFVIHRLKILDWMTTKHFIIGIILGVAGINVLNWFRRLRVWRSAVSIFDLEDGRLFRVIKTVNAKSDVKCLFVKFVDDERANNIGMEPIRKCLVVGENSLKHISERELLGVVLHEYGHVFLCRWKTFVRCLWHFLRVSSICLPVIFLNKMSLVINSDNFDLILIFGLSFSSVIFFSGKLLLKAMDRRLEKKADLFAVKYGGREGLISHLRLFGESRYQHLNPIGFFEYLERDHPLNVDRIDYLKKA